MTAIWTPPATMVDGVVVPASWFNTNLRNNLDYLKDPASAHFDDDASTFSTTSTTFVNITNATGTITTTGGRIKVGATLSVIQAGAAQDVPFTITIDGVNQGNATNGMLRVRCAPGVYALVTIDWFSAVLAAGSHTVNVQVRSPNANGFDVDQMHGYVREVS